MPIPKVLTAIALWARFPTEIESDLSLYHRRSIHEWHRGTMTSRELLVLVGGLPEMSEFQIALRDGDWPIDRKIAARIANELALQRADGTGQMPDLILTPTERAAHDAELELSAREEHTARALVMGQLHGEVRRDEPVQIIAESTTEALHSRRAVTDDG